MTTDQNKAIALIIPLIVKNNAGKVAIALRNAGYSKGFIPQSELEARLFQLYTANPDMFFEIMKTISWNYGEVETNRSEIKDELIKLVSANYNLEPSKDNWWGQLIAMIAPAVPAQQREAAPASPLSKSYGIPVLIALAVVAVAVALYFLFRSSK